jgi:MFS family permease
VTTAVDPTEAELDRETRRRIAVRLLPFLAVLYVANFLDRSSLAYAAPLGMSRDLHFDDRVIGLAAGMFFIGYVAMQVPGTLMVQSWGARRSIAAILVAWGGLTALTGLVQTPWQLYLARFVLGVAESGFFPGIVVYLGRWFRSQDRARATSNFFTAVPISLAIGSPIAGWVVGQRWLDIAGWRWLFVVEGMPAIVLGIVTLFWLTDEPHRAAWLRPAQREWIDRALAQEQPMEAPAPSVRQALRSPLIRLLALCAFLEYGANYCVVYFLPTILKRFTGLPNRELGLVGAIPYVVTLIAVVVVGRHSDRVRERRWHCALLLLVGAISTAVLAVASGSTLLTVAMLSAVGATTLAFVPIFWSLVPDLLGAAQAATAIGTINAIASIGGFVGPLAFGDLATRTGSFTIGLIIVAAFNVIAGVLILRVPSRRLEE